MTTQPSLLPAEPWPGRVAPDYGFEAAAVTQAHKMLREVVEVVIGTRPDAAFLRPVLTTLLQSTLGDFVRRYRQDESDGWASPAAYRQAMAQAIAQMQQWQAQASADEDAALEET